MQPNQQPSWQAAAKKRSRAKLARDLRRAAIVIGLIALAAVLVFLLFPPFFAPQTHLVLLGSHGNDAFNTPPIAFVAEDLEAIASIEEAKVRDQSDVLRSAQTAKHLSNRLAEAGISSRDNLIVYINAHGVTDNASAYLLCDNFDLRQPDLGRVSVDTLIDQVRQSPAATKLILINAGSIDYDPGLGIMGNEFPRRLEQAVHQSKDPSLWVYCSHSSLQYSHVSRAARRSVFGMFVGEGLKGAADLDHDQAIRLSELVAFTSANVSKWVAQSTDRGAQQVPQLIWGGGKTRQSDPKLLTLFEQDPGKELTAASLILPPDELNGGGGSSARSGRVRGLLRRQQVTLASNRIAGGDAQSTEGADATGGDNAKAGGDDGSDGQPADGGDGSVSATDGSADPAAGDSAGGAENADKPGAAGDAKSNPSDADETVKAKQLLTKAWRLRDAASLAWSAADPSLSPVENQPHLWRELQAELLAFEQQLHGGKGYDPAKIETTLADSFPTKAAADPAAAPKAAAAKAAPPLASLFGRASRDTVSLLAVLEPDQTHSLALAQSAALLRGQPLDIDVTGLQAALDQNTRDAFDEWLKTGLRPEFSGTVEMTFIKRLADAPDLDWDLVRIAALTCLAGERVAALDLLSPGWMRVDVERADQFRFFAEQLVFDQVGLQWQQRCRTLFEDAGTIYAAAELAFVDVRRAERALEVLLAKLPSFMHWQRLSRFVPEQRSVIYDDLSTLLELSNELSRLLDQPGRSNVATMSKVREQLESVQSRIEAACGDVSAERLLAQTPTPGDSYQADLLLQTPLLSSGLRNDLLAAMDQRDRQLASNYDLANVTMDDVSAMPLGDASRVPSAEDWRFLFEQAQLESQYVGLSHVEGVKADEFAAITAAREVDAAFEALERVYRAMAVDEATDVSELWDRQLKFGAALQSFFRSAADVDSAMSPCATSPAASRMAIRLLRMLDPRDAWQLDNVDVNSLSLTTKLRSTIRWQAERLEQMSTYRDGNRSATFAGWADHYRTQSERLCRVSAPTTHPTRIKITAPTTVDLQYGDWQQVVLGLENPSDREVSVTVSLEYERQLVDVINVVSAESNGSTANGESIRPEFFDTPSQFGTWRSKPITIAATGSVTLPMKIVRRDEASETTKLVVDVYEPSQLTRAESKPPVLLTRRTLDVMLPVAEVYVRRGAASFVSDVGGVELLPHPNRLEKFRFGVVNHASRTKQISMRCYALGQPLIGPLPSDPSKLLVGALPLASFDVSVPGDGRPTFPSPGEAEPADDQEADGKDAPPKQDEAAKEEEAKPIESTDMPHGMLVELSDRDSGQSTFRHVRFAIQRPRRFVSPRVGFDTKKQQITVEVSAVDPTRLPEGAPVRVECRLADDRSGRTRGKLQGMISRASPTTNLFIATTTPPPNVARVYIDVDGYPRSFIFDVPCGKHLTNVPEVTDSVDLRMTTSSKGGILGATKSIPVAVQIDAPVGSFENGQDHLNLGIDLDGSGVPHPEDSVRLATDRGVMIGFVKSTPDGTVELTNVVSDHLIDLPSERLENLLIDVAASLTINDNLQSFRKIELLIDTAPPVVGPVTRTDGLSFAAVNSQVDLEVWAWDEGSDVTKVQAAFDVDGSGEFPAAGNIFTASRTSDRQWILTVDAGADAGKQSLLVRGVDRVGNESDPVTVEMEVVSPTESSKRVKQQTVTLLGTVQFRENNVADAEVVLTAVPEDPAVAPDAVAPDAAPASPSGVSVRSTESGAYVIAGVSPGSYRLAARAVIRNRVHRIEQDVEVTVGPERTMRVDVTLP
ncbi:carboxypeptidase-like regulatory domain-containing protein [Stieleria neptunia]|uniref:carboxypeptidase-like regulatory domain-containing protein n=1 Tax=Stieleria neptunia TaxID=2527979 RepID=UPI0011A45C7F|nr:carboxypeptidase-like regulatory domain-containing protein [Stieleria neptunia]